MIKVKLKTGCCGCAACVQVCPRGCISFSEDFEGFRYPIANKKECIECGLCEKVCPLLNEEKYKERRPQVVYAAKNKDDRIRMSSSSGGIFTILAEYTIQQNGVVFGARFDDNWEVVHDFTETIDGLSVFRGSKYVQSKIGNCYQITKTFLDKGRLVLFSGTPCQIAGLKSYLRKKYDNLLCVDFICHGVPSPKVWRKYIDNITENVRSGKKSVSFPFIYSFSEGEAQGTSSNLQIESLSFRNKKTGWKKYSFALTFAEASADGKKNIVSLSHIFNKDLFMNLFLNNVVIRPSCYDCKFRSFKSGSDITMGDFWGIRKIFPTFDDDKGVSLIALNTEKGTKMYPSAYSISEKSNIEDCLKWNPSITHSPSRPFIRNIYFSLLPFCRNLEKYSNIFVDFKKK